MTSHWCNCGHTWALGSHGGQASPGEWPALFFCDHDNYMFWTVTPLGRALVDAALVKAGVRR